MAVNLAQIIVLATVFGGFGLSMEIFDGGKRPLHFSLENSAQAMGMDKAKPSPPQLQGTTWYISGWTEAMTLGTTPVKVQFTDNRLSGEAGCNNFSGSYQAQNGSLTIGKALATTRKACAEEIMAQENLFLQLLPQVHSYDFSTDGPLQLTYSRDDKEGTITFIPESQFTALHNSQWQLVSLGGVEPIASESGERRPSIQFNGDRLAGSGGCNRLMGQFSLDGEQITINEQMASTMMACPDPLMEQEQVFIKALTAAQKYQILPTGELVIDYAGDGETKQLVFIPNL